MTVISAVMTRYCTVHASDSLITELLADGSAIPTEWQRSKIVPVKHWRGAMAYWGLAKHEAHDWSTIDWLHEQAKTAANYTSPEEFARALGERLQEAIAQMHFVKAAQAGIGIHFTTYEYVDCYRIPELFLISNWADASYRALHPEGVRSSRETHHAVANALPKHEPGEIEVRLAVHQHLQRGGMLIFNNGDPVLFNNAANAVLGMFRELAARGSLAQPGNVETYLAMARRPIEVVSKAQLDFCREGARVVGGKLHDLAIKPNGEYRSTTGDA